MRIPLALALLLAMTVPTVQAQPATEPAPLLSDATGDVSALIGGQPVAAQPAEAWSAVDLVSLAMGEDPNGFSFDLAVSDLGDDQPRPDFGRVVVSFTFGEATFSAVLYRSADNAAYFGSLYADGHYVRGLPAIRDLETSHLGTIVSRADLVAEDGRTPGKGDQLTGITVASSANAGYTVSTSNSPTTWIGDVMPDDGATATWTVQYRGNDGVGAKLSSEQPFRSSNGDATTYEYSVQALSESADVARYHLTAESLPAGWSVQLPGSLIELPGGKPATFPVQVTVPFAHTHGAAESFTLRLHQEGGDAWATLDLGVHYTAIPQPAGHHPDLYLHSIQWSGTASMVNPPLGGSTGELFMNALAEDPADYGVPVEGWADIGSDQAIYHWAACLDPGLGIGLDFDLQGTGSLSLPVKSTRPLSGAVVEGRLLLLPPGKPLDYCSTSAYSDRDPIVLADVSGPATEIGSGAETLLQATVTPTARADYVPFEDGAILVLEFTLTGQGPGIGGTGGATLMPGGMLSLPLVEYHDAVAVLSGGDGGSAPVPGFVAEPAPAKDTPAAPAGLAVAALGLLALAVRRRAA